MYLLQKSTTDEIGNLGKAIVVHVCVPDQKTNYSTISFGKQMGRWQTTYLQYEMKLRVCKTQKTK